MKKQFFIILLVLALVGWGFYLTKVFLCKSEIKAVEKQTEQRVTDSIQSRLSSTYDSLKRATDRKFDSIDSLYRNKEVKIITRYEKIYIGLDTISLDSSIKFFSKYIPETSGNK